jgi:Holliday junction resolvase-like predicted endonuclease
MPAYRSAAEAAIREAVVARLRQGRADARIIHEINVSSFGPTRIDLIAVSREEIIAVEVKSAKDKLDRLKGQLAGMRSVAHHAIVALHERFLIEQPTNRWAAHYERDGQFFLKRPPDDLRPDSTWVFPEKRRTIKPTIEGGWDDLENWRLPSCRQEALPAEALGLLWRDEIYALCGKLRVSVGRRATVGDMVPALRWFCSGSELTRGICTALRLRQCIEADAPVEDLAA